MLVASVLDAEVETCLFMRVNLVDIIRKAL
jgi:hypothetical protein